MLVWNERICGFSADVSSDAFNLQIFADQCCASLLADVAMWVAVKLGEIGFVGDVVATLAY